MSTKQEAVIILKHILEAIDQLTQEAGYAVSGHIYAAMQGILTLDQYQECLKVLVDSDLIAISGNHTIKSTDYAHNLLTQGESTDGAL